MLELFIDLFADLNDLLFRVYFPDSGISNYRIVADPVIIADLLVEKSDVFLNDFMGILPVEIIHDNAALAFGLPRFIHIGDDREKPH
jgi:hypothetical protein